MDKLKIEKCEICGMQKHTLNGKVLFDYIKNYCQCHKKERIKGVKDYGK